MKHAVTSNTIARHNAILQGLRRAYHAHVQSAATVSTTVSIIVSGIVRRIAIAHHVQSGLG
eukprot:4862538-Karenia_brevis.AAC.1